MWDLYAREFVGTPVDVWALGCMLYLLCYGRLPFDAEAKLQILNGRYTLPAGQRPPAMEALLHDMLKANPLERMTIDQVRAAGRLAGRPSQATRARTAGRPAASAGSARGGCQPAPRKPPVLHWLGMRLALLIPHCVALPGGATLGGHRAPQHLEAAAAARLDGSWSRAGRSAASVRQGRAAGRVAPAHGVARLGAARQQPAGGRSRHSSSQAYQVLCSAA